MYRWLKQPLKYGAACYHAASRVIIFLVFKDSWMVSSFISCSLETLAKSRGCHPGYHAEYHRNGYCMIGRHFCKDNKKESWLIINCINYTESNKWRVDRGTHPKATACGEETIEPFSIWGQTIGLQGKAAGRNTVIVAQIIYKTKISQWSALAWFYRFTMLINVKEMYSGRDVNVNV